MRDCLPGSWEDVEPGLGSGVAEVGTPREVMVSELAIAAFYPADEATRAFFTGVSNPEGGSKPA